ncbi:bromodomain-containing protein 9 [Brassica napus]|uniref:bromodomain-containing protein 9 n=1 Tax=Brassica napus TaxID=3708 RepID=UPI00207A586A|nr:bromodomain-containing protein 9 [Brassica napus]
MGEVADTLTKKRKKKGRPSLIEVQKRALKQQQLLQSKLDESKEEVRSGFGNPNSAATRSNRRIVNPSEEDEEEEDDDERRDKKKRLLHGLNSHDDRRESELDGDASSISRRKIGAAGSDVTGQKGSKATDILQRASLVDSGPVTPLPDKKLLLFILDRVQKKDTYGVYSDPVDPEELPDYHEIIKNPMDFTTLREKLEAGAYATLEQFEEDVFLICTNAMEYNSSDTIYHRQARAMLELAKKDFADLRQESDGEVEPVSQSQQQPKIVKRGRPPGSGLKKHSEPFLTDRTISESSADAAAAHTPGGDGSRLSGAYNLRRTPPSVRINHYSENQNGLLIDWEKEFPPSVVKAVNKYGMKNVDENRRDSYFLDISPCSQEASVCTTLEDGLKQLTPVGLNTEYGYARSLARYAANLGPVAWRLASKRIETVLPSGTEFGPGWVGEKPEAPQQQKCSNDLASESIHSSKESKGSASAARLLNQATVKSELLINPESNGLVRGCRGVNQMLETAAFSRQGLSPNTKPELNRFHPDLNAKIVSPNSPVSNLQAGSSQQHPDLALQL